MNTLSWRKDLKLNDVEVKTLSWRKDLKLNAARCFLRDTCHREIHPKKHS